MRLDHGLENAELALTCNQHCVYDTEQTLYIFECSQSNPNNTTQAKDTLNTYLLQHTVWLGIYIQTAPPHSHSAPVVGLSQQNILQLRYESSILFGILFYIAMLMLTLLHQMYL